MKHAFTGEVYTGVPFPNYEDLQKSRSESSKSEYPGTYDRYEKYHYPAGEMSKLDKVIGTFVEKVISTIKKIIKYDN